jgi:NAD+ kinase
MREGQVVTRVGLVVKPDAEARRNADRFEQWLSVRDVVVIRRESPLPTRGRAEEERHTAPADLLCVFVLGGDGTFLSAVRWIGDRDIPVIGVKFGEVGFLADTAEDSLSVMANAILQGNFRTQPRMRLVVKVIRDGREHRRETVLNDVVINKGALARLAQIDTYIDGNYLTTYRADGLIVATPTGSTAYSLAAGGPIVHPAVAGILMTPICPFTLTNRPLIVPETVGIKIQLAKKSADIMLTFDGQEGLGISERDVIMVRKSEHPIRMISVPGQNYFDVLKAKLRWSGGRV